jgi:predicted ArsR family transcriptional regulator
MAGKSVHYALAEPKRAAIVELLRRRGPLDARELGAAVGLHPNTVRSHLDVLREAKLVGSQAERTARVGRPRLVFEALRSPPEAEHELLAAALAESLWELPDGTARAEAAGEAWGRRIAAGRAPATVVDLLEERGFDPERTGSELRMHRCPFAELAESYPEVVCALHLGLLRGAQRELGDAEVVEELRPFVEPHLCVATLSR